MTDPCPEHNPKPVEQMRAVYRCAACGQFFYKAAARQPKGVSKSYTLTPYKCHAPGCDERVVVVYPMVRYRKKLQPSCSLHRRDSHGPKYT